MQTLMNAHWVGSTDALRCGFVGCVWYVPPAVLPSGCDVEGFTKCKTFTRWAGLPSPSSLLFFEGGWGGRKHVKWGHCDLRLRRAR